MSSGVDPQIVKRAVELGLIQPGEADRFLRDPPAPKPLAIVPKVPPPRERLTLIRRPDGRLLRARQRFTRALLAAGVIDRTAVKTRHKNPTPEEETA